MSDKSKEKSLDKLEAELKGKTLLVYWHMIKQNAPTGIREIQRALKFSSPSIAHHHLEKLISLGLVKKDEYGRYLLKEYVEVELFNSSQRLVDSCYLAFHSTHHFSQLCSLLMSISMLEL